MPKDPLNFPGFSAPNYTQVPDELFDVLLPALSEAELKVLLYVVRRTFGFKKDADAISVTQMEKGIVTKGGRVLDQGTGLSRTSIRKGSAGLVEKGILTVARVKSEEGDYETNVYRLRFAERGVGQILTHPRTESVPPVGQILTPQETVVQETVEQERAVEPSKIREVPHELIEKYDDDRLELLPYAQDLAREMNDQAPLTSTTTRLVNLYKASGASMDEFLDRLMQARAITQERTASIKAPSDTSGSAWGRKPKMQYLFAVLDDLLGQRRERVTGP